MTVRFDVLGGDGDNHRLELADFRWWGTENLFTDRPRGARPIEQLVAAIGQGAKRFEHYRIVKL